MIPQTDPQIAEALSTLDTPEHHVDFWESLESEMEATKPRRLASAEGRSRILLLVAASAFIVAATVGVLAWQGSGTSLETVSPIADLPTITGTGQVEGPFPFIVLEPATDDRLFVSRPVEFDELPPCFANEDESDRSQVEILELDLGRTAEFSSAFPEAPELLATVQTDWIFERLITPGPNSTHLVHNSCIGQANALGLHQSGDPSATTDLDAPEGHLISHATWGEDGLLSVTFFENTQSAGPLSYLRRTFDPTSGGVLGEEAVDSTVVSRFADGTEIASGNDGLVVGGVTTSESRDSGWATVALSPNGTFAAVFSTAFSNSEVLVIDATGTVLWRWRNGTPIDATWTSDSQLIIGTSDDSNISEFTLVSFAAATPTTSTFDPGLGPITLRSVTAAPRGRLAISGTNRSASDSTWFVPAPSADSATAGSGGQEANESSSQSGDDLATLAPPAEDFGPGWGDPFIDLLPPGIELFDPAELSPTAPVCAALDPVVIPSGYIIEYGYNGSPDDGLSILAAGTSAEVDQLFDVFSTLECVTAFEPDTATDFVDVAGAERAVIYDGEDDRGQVSQGIVVDFGQQLLVLDLAIQPDTGQIDLVSILDAHLASR